MVRVRAIVSRVVINLVQVPVGLFRQLLAGFLSKRARSWRIARAGDTLLQCLQVMNDSRAGGVGFAQDTKDTAC